MSREHRQRRNPPTAPSSDREPVWLRPVLLDPELAAILADKIRGSDLADSIRDWEEEMPIAEMLDQMARHDGTRSAQGKWLAGELQQFWQEGYQPERVTRRLKERWPAAGLRT